MTIPQLKEQDMGGFTPELVGLKPCGFCGATELYTVTRKEDGLWIVGCNHCEALGPTGAADWVAREWWNRRPYEEASGIAELTETLAKIAEHKTDHPCASAWEEDRRTLVEVQAMAERALAKLGGNQ